MNKCTLELICCFQISSFCYYIYNIYQILSKRNLDMILVIIIIFIFVYKLHFKSVLQMSLNFSKASIWLWLPEAFTLFKNSSKWSLRRTLLKRNFPLFIRKSSSTIAKFESSPRKDPTKWLWENERANIASFMAW